MNEVICPHCAKAFQVDEAGYANILKQVYTREFESQLNERLTQAEKEKVGALKLLEKESESTIQAIKAEKEIKIERLNSQIREKESSTQLVVDKAVRAMEKERDKLNNDLKNALLEKQNSENLLKDKYKNQIRDRDDHIERLKDMKAKNIGHSILVTTALPKDFNKAKNGYVGRHGNRIIIIPMDYSIIHAVVSLIRGNLINIYKTKKDLNVSRELTKLWDHITGPSFQIPMRTLYLSINKSRDLLEKEKTFWNKHLSNKERNLSDMDEQFMDVINSFTLKVSENLLPETLVQVERQAIKERNEKNSLSNKKNKEDN